MIAYNSAEKESTLNTDRFNERMSSFKQAVNVLTNQQLNSLQNLIIPAKTTLVLELQK